MTDQHLGTYPYAGTSGYASGSITSRERADAADRDGTTRNRQAQALRALDARGAVGLTWHELADLLDLHHGQASGLLSGLHKSKRVARLAHSRRRCRVYVLPEHVLGRDTERHGSTAVRHCPNCGAEL